jgi:hypothetical protein
VTISCWCNDPEVFFFYFLYIFVFFFSQILIWYCWWKFILVISLCARFIWILNLCGGKLVNSFIEFLSLPISHPHVLLSPPHFLSLTMFISAPTTTSVDIILVTSFISTISIKKEPWLGGKVKDRSGTS